MLARRNPGEVYRRVDFDARVSGATPGELVRLCYEQLVSSLGGALIAAQRGDNQMKSQMLTRAISALNALHMGVAGEDGIAGALIHFYTATRRAVLDSVLDFDADTIAQVRQDFIDISESMNRAAH
ncbi:flagellar export chaperone FliS [Novosphingobium sp. KACC 22771]|uniref:flagellar export chaperone FliS n=1 Tax=Novosphingobium sp. KACC 22771 TaxID=3025670 RepID=UPI002365C04C|nr:flagellar protein FliS [Novosphingobium sp. KACC 22771]WDF73248.1 flagellar protein FliS [Novosphingobium sp. KACC 22771]